MSRLTTVVVVAAAAILSSTGTLAASYLTTGDTPGQEPARVLALGDVATLIDWCAEREETFLTHVRNGDDNEVLAPYRDDELIALGHDLVVADNPWPHLRRYGLDRQDRQAGAVLTLATTILCPVSLTDAEPAPAPGRTWPADT